MRLSCGWTGLTLTAICYLVFRIYCFLTDPARDIEHPAAPLADNDAGTGFHLQGNTPFVPPDDFFCFLAGKVLDFRH